MQRIIGKYLTHAIGFLTVCITSLLKSITIIDFPCVGKDLVEPCWWGRIETLIVRPGSPWTRRESKE